LAHWTENGKQMRISSCETDSVDASGAKLQSRLEVRLEDQAAGKIVWKIRDGVGAGRKAPQVFVPGVVALDVDGDGSKETFFGYHFPSPGPAPLQVKFMAHRDGRKFAIRGALPRTESDTGSSTSKFDTAFAAASPRFKAAAESLYTDFATRLCADPSVGCRIASVAKVSNTPKPVAVTTPTPASPAPSPIVPVVTNVMTVPVQPANVQKSSSSLELDVGGVRVAPGGWVDDATFSRLDTQEPEVMSESVSPAGVRIRWWRHQGKGFSWISTNDGMPSPDGPYWVQQVQTSQHGACAGREPCVGAKDTGKKPNAERVVKSDDRELTIRIHKGLVTELVITSEQPPPQALRSR